MATSKKGPPRRNSSKDAERETKINDRKIDPALALEEVEAQRRRVEHQAHVAEVQRADLLAVASHDLRNPLGVVLVTTTMLARELTAPNQLEQVAAIRRAATEMTHVIEDLVDAACIDTGTLDLGEDDCVPAEVVQEAITAARSMVGERAIVVEAELEAELPSLPIDHHRLLQVFSRIVANAVRFMKSGTLTFRGVREGQTVRFSVLDSGPAITDSQYPYAFLRRPPPGKRACRGTGLGMFVVKGIVEAYGGHVELTSDAESGNKVSFTLPLRRVEERAKV